MIIGSLRSMPEAVVLVADGGVELFAELAGELQRGDEILHVGEIA